MKKKQTLALLMGGLLALTGTGLDPFQSLFRENRAGNQALESGDVAEALRHYTEAQGLAPDDPRVLYNLGLALAASGEQEKAAQLWRQAAELSEGDLRRDSWFNQGVLAFEEQDAAKAVQAFSEALLVDPEDAEAQRNLELALRNLQQQQQQQPNQQSDEQEQNDQQQQQQQQASQGSQGDQQDDQQQQQQQEQQPGEQQQEQQSQGEQQQEQQSQGEQQEQQQSSSDQSPQQANPDAGEQLQDGQQEMAERLLEQLAKGEKDALRRALTRRAEKGAPKDKGGRTW